MTQGTGFVPDTEDRNDAKHELLFGASYKTPEKPFDWRDVTVRKSKSDDEVGAFEFPLINQGNENTCIPCSLSHYGTFRSRLEGLQNNFVDKNVVLNHKYQRDHITMLPGGSTYRDNGQSFRKRGICEQRFEGNNGVYSLEAHNNAATFKIKNFSYVNGKDRYAILNAVQRDPIAIGVPVDFNTWNTDGVIKPGIANFLHSVLLIGFTKEMHYIIANSHGSNWQDNGFGVLRNDYPIIQAISFEDLPDNWKELQNGKSKRSCFISRLFKL